ncbi:adenosine 5'-monophosphoramidase HINT3-like [Periplaneta americana]|uniref:adenosine 5'-monophosphoramidase HINT3-like n=1 Tax=Periplaneta americana TaxID=6978 RepID=UPI0037E77569
MFAWFVNIGRSKCWNLLKSPFQNLHPRYDLGIQRVLLRNSHNKFQNMSQRNDNCVFCRISDGREKSEILYKDDEYVVFPDIKPATKHHYLVITREHIPNAKVLSSEHKHIVEKLVEIANQVLTEKDADLTDVRYGFHWPPFNSIQHLHLHAISPASNMGLISRLIFRQDSWWFVSHFIW